jgi:hypothetical protein
MKWKWDAVKAAVECVFFIVFVLWLTWGFIVRGGFIGAALIVYVLLSFVTSSIDEVIDDEEKRRKKDP